MFLLTTSQSFYFVFSLLFQFHCNIVFWNLFSCFYHFKTSNTFRSKPAFIFSVWTKNHLNGKYSYAINAIWSSKKLNGQLFWFRRKRRSVLLGQWSRFVLKIFTFQMMKSIFCSYLLSSYCLFHRCIDHVRTYRTIKTDKTDSLE